MAATLLRFIGYVQAAVTPVAAAATMAAGPYMPLVAAATSTYSYGSTMYKVYSLASWLVTPSPTEKKVVIVVCKPGADGKFAAGDITGSPLSDVELSGLLTALNAKKEEVTTTDDEDGVVVTLQLAGKTLPLPTETS